MKSLEDLQRSLAAGRISRREFLAQSTALGISATLATTVLERTARAATPKKGGTMRIGIGAGSTTDSLDPATWENQWIQLIGWSSQNYLTEVNAKGKLVPELAESWEASPDAVTWTFKIRDGVEFHNGKTMDADDVVASINHHRGADSKSAAKGIVDPIEDIKADGKNVVVFALKGGSADFPYLMNDYHLAIMPSKDGKVDATSGIGAGGYMVKDFDAGVRCELMKFANFWKSDRAFFDGGEIITIADVAARTNALTTGEIDVMNGCDLKTVHLLKRQGNVRVEETSGTQHYTAPMRTDTPPFDDNNIRMALKHAVDREALVSTILRGHGTVGNDHPIGRSDPYFDTSIPQRTYDPDKAKYYLKQAGLDSLQVDLSAADAAFAGAVDAATLYKEHAAKAGIDINVIREPNDGYWSDVWMKKPWCMCYWSGRPTEDWMFSTAYAEDANWNDTFWKNDRFNKLLKQARAELDPKLRGEMYGEMQLIVRDEGGVVIPMFANYVFASRENVEHQKDMSAMWDLDGFKLMERWWFA
jgi:peptide/nickel transport system substrate-binding protein